MTSSCGTDNLTVVKKSDNSGCVKSKEILDKCYLQLALHESHAKRHATFKYWGSLKKGNSLQEIKTPILKNLIINYYHYYY